jgi:hypothetical protein
VLQLEVRNVGYSLIQNLMLGCALLHPTYNKLRFHCVFFAKDTDNEGVIFLSSVLLKRLTTIPIDITIVLYPPQVN